MAVWMGIAVILAASFLLGWLIVRQFFAKRPFSGTPLEFTFAALTIGIIVVGWISFVLAEIGKFSLIALLFLWAGTVLFFAWRTWRSKIGLHTVYAPAAQKRLLPFLPDWVEFAALGIWLITAVFLFLRPHQFITGAADAGVYVNLGANIARTGRILIQNDVLASLPPALYPAFLRPIANAVAPHYIFPAFFVIGEPVGEITPQFYHLHAVWMAVANSMGSGNAGVQAELLLPGVWAVLGSLAIYFTVRRIAGWEVALLALAGLTLNALQIWFARYPTTESLTQFLLWAGLWSLSVWMMKPEKRPLWGLLAGLALGQSFLVRIDMLFILPIFALLAAWLWAQDGWKRAYNWFFLPLLLLVLHSLVHALWQSRPYFFELFGFALRLLQVNWLIPASALLFGLVLLVALGRYRDRLHQLNRFKRPFLATIALTFIIWSGYNWFIRPYIGEVLVWNDPYSAAPIPNYNHENLIRLGWYLSPVGVWLGIIGIGLQIWQANKKTAVMLAVTLLITLLYITNIRANPHQIYAMRRYLPAVMPIFIIGAAYFISALAAHKKIWSSSLALILTLAWLVGFGWLARGFVTQIDYQGILPQFDQFNDLAAPNSILIFNDPAPIGQGDIIGTPLRFLKGYNVLTLRDPDALNKQQFAQIVSQWHDQGYGIYWVAVENGFEWPLSEQRLDEVGMYTIHTSALEGSFDHRPSQLQTSRWQGHISVIQPEE